jgi:hypothetical protein
MPEGTGAGYNIPISVSYARTDTINPILNAGTVFNFSSPWGSGGTNDVTSRLTSSATATSSAAEGNASAATQASTSSNGNDSTGGGPKWLTYAVIAGIALSAITLWVSLRRR